MPYTIIDFLGYYKKGEVDDYAFKLGFKDFYSLLSNVFQVDNDLNNESLDNIKNTLDKITYFFYFYKDMYNSIKHGSRAFQHSVSHFDLFFDDEPDSKQMIPIDEMYIKVICKIIDHTESPAKLLKAKFHELSVKTLSIINFSPLMCSKYRCGLLSFLCLIY